MDCNTGKTASLAGTKRELQLKDQHVALMLSHQLWILNSSYFNEVNILDVFLYRSFVVLQWVYQVHQEWRKHLASVVDL
jgi:hypothetical protein